VSLEQACKTFSKKPVTQLEPVEGLDILLSLSDGNVGVHELGSLKIMPKATESIGATKGAASAFAADVQVLTVVYIVMYIVIYTVMYIVIYTVMYIVIYTVMYILIYTVMYIVIYTNI